MIITIIPHIINNDLSHLISHFVKFPHLCGFFILQYIAFTQIEIRVTQSVSRPLAHTRSNMWSAIIVFAQYCKFTNNKIITEIHVRFDCK